MPERNIWTQAAVEVGQELAAARRRAAHSKVIPFGEERLSAEALRKRLQEDQQFRREFLSEPGGRDKMLRLFKSQTSSKER